MPFAYLSREWLDEGRKLVDASAEFRSAAKGLTASFLSIVNEAPGGQTIYLFHRFKDGAIQEVQVGTDVALRDRAADFKATGTYETFSLVNQGKLGSVQAFFQRKIKLEGDLGKALRFIKPVEVFNGILRKVPTVY